ncbi:MAG: hypothetical protein ABIJ23_04930 [Candidatus Magasanikbacteria bacterium]
MKKTNPIFKERKERIEQVFFSLFCLIFFVFSLFSLFRLAGFVYAAIPLDSTNLTVTNVTISSISITWLDNATDEDGFIIGWSTDGVDFDTTSTTITSSTDPVFPGIGLSTGTMQFNSVNLVTNTSYWYRVAAYNASGTSAYVTTTEATYTLANTADTPTIGTPTTSTLPITINVNSNPAATTYAVYNSTDSNYLDANGASTSTAVYSTTSTLGASFAATGLSINTAYQFTVVARNGDSVLAATSTASTAVYTVANIPSSVSAITDSTTQITLTWSGDASKYYAENTTASTTSGWISATSSSFTSLTCGTSYTFRVKGRNGDEVETAYASSVSATTSDCPATPSSNTGVPAPVSTPPTQKSGQPVISQTSNNTIKFNIENAIEMAVSTDSDFINSSFESYTNTLDISDYTNGQTIYIKFRSDNGGTYTITYVIGEEQETIQDTNEATTCSLTEKQVYKHPASTAVYYITEDCTKRAFSRSDVFFTYFHSWNDVKTTTKTKLDSITNDTLGFMPWGPNYDPKYGALVKIVTDPKVYLLLNTEKYWITSEAVFTALKYSWNWIEDVATDLLDKYIVGSEITYTNHHPNYTLIKYKDNNKVYRLEPDPTDTNTQLKRWITDEATFNSLNFRWDRIVIVDDSEVYEMGNNLVQ